MKKYLNKVEKNQMSILVHFQAFLEDFVSTQKKLKRPSKWYQTSLSFLIKATKEWVSALDDSEIAIVFDQMKKLRLVLRTIPEAEKEYHKKKEEDLVVAIDNEDFLTLCSYGFGTCATCTLVDYERCALRILFITYDIEPISDNCDGCQYNLNALKENAYFNLYESNGFMFRAHPEIQLPGFTLLLEGPLPAEHWGHPKITL